jgi:hypothetical protein
MRHSLFKYFSERKWADAFLDGQVLFRSLSYFRDYEDGNIRGDCKEGTATFRPPAGLVINNLTQEKTSTLAGHAFESSARHDEIFVFCASRSHNDERREKFGATACIEILKIGDFCRRVETALPPGSAFFATRVAYYQEEEAGNPRWALPEHIATSKVRGYSWQDEYRLVFGSKAALSFENVALRIVQDGAESTTPTSLHQPHLVQARSFHDICRVHDF